MKKILSMAAVALMCLASCSRNMNGLMGIPTSSGRPYEVMVVMDTLLWDKPIGHALEEMLETPVPGLPQMEASFHVSKVHPNRFSSMFEMFRNLIVVDINPKMYTQTKFRFVRDEFASPQMVLYMHSPSYADMTAYIRDHAEQVVDFFTRAEMNRELDELKEKYSVKAEELAREMFDCELRVPKEINSFKKGTDFFWTSSNGASANVNICMYAYPYEGPQAFQKEALIQKRDSFMKANIPGAQPFMYMSTDHQRVWTKEIPVKHQYAVEIRGLWQMQNGGMGGPFVSHARVDTVHNRMVVVEGFVFAPEKMKRGLIRRLEASLYSLNLPAEENQMEMEMPELVVTNEK